ncbi:MAG: YggS family pyridoxal phosphate-dependent enzyme [Saprospiraceae bacterium]
MLDQVLNSLQPTETRLVAVSKTKPNEQIVEMYDRGQRIFGENRVQEVTDKHAALPKDIEWHFIGHLQTNKVKYIAPFISLIHSVDSLKILKEINKQAKRNERIIDGLLQFHIAEEDTKYGLDLAEAQALLASDAYAEMENIRLVGVMGMATFTDDKAQVRREFQQLQQIFSTLKKNHFAEADAFKEISMGMSGDYLIAMEEGSTLVRIGSLLFGSRH